MTASGKGFVCIALLIAFFPPLFSSDKPASKTDPTLAIQASVRKLSEARGRLRLSILEITPVQKEYEGKNALGSMIASRISISVSALSNVRLYERAKLDALVKEQKLSLSGLVSSDDALKIGELVPVDAILCGAWAMLDSAAEVQYRLLDVVTGQVLETGMFRLDADADLLALLGKSATAGDPCGGKYKKMTNLLSDLSSDEKIQAAVDWLVTVEPRGDCGGVHAIAAEKFMAYHILSPVYHAFCLRWLTNQPDFRSETFFRLGFYLTADGHTDAEEWQAVLTAIPYLTEPMYYGDAMRPYLFPKADGSYDKPLTDAQRAEIASLRDAYFARVKSPGFGLPVRLTYDAAFLAFYSALNICPDNRVMVAFLSAYATNVQPETLAKTGDTLRYRFKKETDAHLKTLIARAAADNALRRTDNQNVYDLWQFSEICEKEGGEAWAVFLSLAKPAMEKLFPAYSKDNPDAGAFLKRNGLRTE